MGFRLGVHLLVATLLAWASAGAATLETAEHRDVLPIVRELVAKYGAENVLVAYDYDNTIAAARGYLGSEVWFESVQKALADGGSPIPGLDSYEDLVGLQHALFRRHPAVILQRDLPDQVAAVQATGARVQVMSSRNAQFFDVVSNDLARFGMRFERSAYGPRGGYPDAYPMVEGSSAEVVKLAGPHPRRKVLFRDGLYLTAGQNKGAALRALFEKTGYHPKAIVFIDDRGRHLDSVEAAFDRTGIEAVTIRYTRGDAQRQRYEQVAPELAWRWLAEATKRLPHDCRSAWALFGQQ